MSGSYAMAIIPVVGTYGYYCERQAILGTAAALEELLDAEGTVDEVRTRRHRSQGLPDCVSQAVPP